MSTEIATTYLDHRTRLAQASTADDLMSRVAARRAGQPKPAGTPAAPATAPTPEEGEDGVIATAGKVAKDIGVGIVETPRAITKGARDAVQSVIGMGDELGGWIEQTLDLPGIHIGEDGVRILSAEELQAARAEGQDVASHLKLPDLNAPQTVTGGVVKGVTQFLVGMKGANVALNVARLPKASGALGYSRAALQGFIANFAAFDPHQQRLSNLIEQFPALQNPVTSFLSSEADDSAAEGRFKNAIEGLGLGVLSDGFLKSVKLLRNAGKARSALEQADMAVETAPSISKDAFRELGDDAAAPGSPIVSVPTQAKPPVKGLPIAQFRAEAVEIERTLPPVQEGFTRLWRGNRSGEVGQNPNFTNDLPGIALPFRKVYGGDLSYVDVPTAKLEEWVSKGAAAEGAEFHLSKEFAAQAKVVVPAVKTGQVFINFARIDAPDDVKNALQQLADVNKTSIDAARRGTQTFEQIKLNAAQKDAWQVLASRRMGEPLNAESAVAARQLWAASGEKLSQLARMASENPSESNLFAFRKMVATHHAIQQEVIAARTETARALASWRIPAGGGAERMRDITSVLTENGGTEAARELATRVAKLAGAGMYNELDEVVKLSAYARTRDAVLEAWINGLLSSPPTHIVNTMSNSLTIGLRMVERATGAKISNLLGDEQAVAAGEAAQQWFGITHGIRDAMRYAWKAAKTGDSGFGTGKLETARAGSITSEAFNLSSQGWLGRGVDMLGSIVRVPGRLLTSEDEFFKTIGYRMELHANALRTATREAASGQIARDGVKMRVAELVINPPESLRMAAVDAAMYQTFTNTPGKIAQGLGRITSEYPALKVIMPFIRTPANILRFTFERTPLAPAMQQFRANISAGGARRDLALAQMGVGTMAMLSSADLAMNGQISGSGPKDHGTRAAMARQGWQPYSIKIGERWFAYNRLDPVGSLFGMASDTVEALRNAQHEAVDEADTEKLAVATVVAFAANLTNKTYLSGLSSVFEALGDPQRYSEATIQRMVGSVVPAAVANVARQMDPMQRQVYSMLDAIKARTPGLSDHLPPKLNLWGEPIQYESGLGTAYDALSPIYTREGSNEPIDAELIRLEANVTLPKRRTSFNGATVDLGQHPAAYSRYVELSGNALKHPAWGLGAKDLLNQIVTGQHPLSQVYQIRSDGPDGGKAIYIKDILRQYQERARDQVAEEFPELGAEVQTKRERARALRMPTIG